MLTFGFSISESLLFGIRFFDATEEIAEKEIQIHILCFCFFVVYH